MNHYPSELQLGDLEQSVSAIHFDSREVGPGSLFVAVLGLTVDGHQFIDKAIAAGALAVVCEKLPPERKEGVAYVVVENSAEALGHYAAAFYNFPSQKLQLVGITGTNGKTTSATLLQGLFKELGHRTGLISTIENKVDDEVLLAKFTTPDAIALNKLLAEMVARGCTCAFMEVSSHALEQHRVAGVTFAGGIFSNISHDHLDYHKTFDNYIKAKKKLFDGLPKKAFALVNKDDKRGLVMLQNCLAEHHTFALKAHADFKVRIIENTFDGLLLEIDGKQTWFRLTGSFNAYNLVAVYAAAVLLGEEAEQVLTVLSALVPARGRFEQLVSKENVRAIIDYCHTPDALKNVLETIKEIKSVDERIITVVGCGGDRDRGKRPKMAAIAAKFSEKVILTSDNPRSEEPGSIIEDMKKGIGPAERARTLAITDRREAIKTACMLAQPSDILLIAGKGHETYQEIKGVRYPFDDKQIVSEILSN